MANVKITDLDLDTAPASTDVLPFVDISSDETKKVTVEDLLESAGDGAAATPAFSFDNDKSVGMWRPGSEQLAFSTSGLTRLLIDSSGNIKLTSNEHQALAHKTTGYSTSYGAITVGSPGSNQGNVALAVNVSAINGSNFVGQSQVIFPANGGLFPNSGGTDYVGVFSRNSSDSLLIGPATAGGKSNGPMTLTSTNVGIGTSSPGANLEVKGSEPEIRLRDSRADDAGYWGFKSELSSGERKLFIQDDGVDRITLDASGQVGIGDTAPSEKLNVAGNIMLEGSDQYLYLTNVGTGNSGIYVRGNTSGSYLRSHSTGIFTWEVAGSEKMRIDSSGKVGIGETSMDALLVIKGNSDANTTPSIRLKDGTDTREAWITNSAGDLSLNVGGDDNVAHGTLKIFESGILDFAQAAGSRLRIDTSGRLLVGTSSSSSNSRAVFQGNTSDSTTSGIIRLARGSSSPSDGDSLGAIAFTDSGHSTAAAITSQRDGGTWTSGSSQPTRLVFSTTANSAASATERLRIGSGGKFTAPTIYSLTTTGGGAVYVESDGDLLRYTSSLKYKTDVETIEDARADAILNCRPVWYRSKCANDVKTEGAEKSDWGWYGFIAEEVAEVEPRLVNWATKDAVEQEDGSVESVERDPADYEAEGVRYDNFVPLLVNLVKRQQQAIEALEQRLTDAGL